MVHWIPPRLKIEKIRKIITNQLGTEATINRREGKSKVDVTFPAGLKQQVSHYIQTTFLDRNGMGEDRLWFVTMEGREQECRFCGDTRHWPTSCPQHETLANVLPTTRDTGQRPAHKGLRNQPNSNQSQKRKIKIQQKQ